MMKTAGSINGIAGQGSNAMQPDSSGSNMQADPVSKNLQNQIANAQQKLQSLSSDEKMTPEEKMKKRQEIQQEITSLNQQLRQHQIDRRREERAKEQAKSAMTDNTRNAEPEKSENQDSGLSKTRVNAMISADSSMKQAKVHKNVETQLGAAVSVLQSEIHLDAGRGQSTEKKQEELAKVEGKANAAASSQMSVLGDANKAMKEAAEEERDEKKIKTKEGLTLLKGDDTPKKKIGEYVTVDVRG